MGRWEARERDGWDGWDGEGWRDGKREDGSQALSDEPAVCASLFLFLSLRYLFHLSIDNLLFFCFFVLYFLSLKRGCKARLSAL